MIKENSGSRSARKRSFKPSDYMRAQHPDLFPDTPPLETPVLDKGFLEYQLETLTSRKQELLFEEFCRRLVELEICPNIKPQTGPIGGGDSKVDASSYPIAPELATRCYWGSPQTPADDSWGFAFSCKKDWRSKVRNDMRNIATSDRKFTKTFFISNQFTRDKKRAELENELSQEYDFEVHILDRSWIVKCVIEHKREELAIQKLGLTKLQTKKTEIGPRDASRQERLTAVLGKLSEPELYHGNDYALAGDYLDAALLARGLGKSRHEVDGLFDRSRTLATKAGYWCQILQCGYHHAWTSWWWYDDESKLQQIYCDIEGCLTDTQDAEDCELFHNLWLLLHSAVSCRQLSPKLAKLNQRLQNIKDKLALLAAEETRPNNALHAQTLLCLLRISPNISDENEVKAGFAGLKICLKKSVGLGSYPAMKYINLLIDMGDILGELPGYDLLFNEIRRIAKGRWGDISEGRLLLQRGLQVLEKGDNGKALLLLGKARIRLTKAETLDEDLRATLGCSDAYMNMGLLWAARMEALAAAHMVLRDIETTHKFAIDAFLSARRLSWLELRLGRLTAFRHWHGLTWHLIAHLQSIQYGTEDLEKYLRYDEIVLGSCFLRLSPVEAKELSRIIPGLERANLHEARDALLFALGDLDALEPVIAREFNNDPKELQVYFEEWKNRPVPGNIPHKLVEATKTFYNFETTIMGVKYQLRTRNHFGAICFSENVLGIVEAGLALAKWENLAFIVDEFKMIIDVASAGRNPPKIDFQTPPDERGYELLWKPDMLRWLNGDNRQQVCDYLFMLFLMLLGTITIDPWDDIRQELDQWHREETFSRALAFSPLSMILIDLIGENGYDIEYWSETSTSSEI